MLHKLQRRARDEKGFTLIELLVVILIIGILAAIAIPAFLGQRARAQDTSAKSAVRQAQTAIETYGTDNGGKYATPAAATKATLEDIEESLKTSPGSTLAVSGVTNTTYTLTVTSDSGNTFSIAKADGGVVSRDCVRTTGRGGCPTNLKW